MTMPSLARHGSQTRRSHCVPERPCVHARTTDRPDMGSGPFPRQSIKTHVVLARKTDRSPRLDMYWIKEFSLAAGFNHRDRKGTTSDARDDRAGHRGRGIVGLEWSNNGRKSMRTVASTLGLYFFFHCDDKTILHSFLDISHIE
jgi:hypothetical protein